MQNTNPCLRDYFQFRCWLGKSAHNTGFVKPEGFPRKGLLSIDSCPDLGLGPFGDTGRNWKRSTPIQSTSCNLLLEATTTGRLCRTCQRTHRATNCGDLFRPFLTKLSSIRCWRFLGLFRLIEFESNHSVLSTYRYEIS